LLLCPLFITTHRIQLRHFLLLPATFVANTISILGSDGNATTVGWVVCITWDAAVFLEIRAVACVRNIINAMTTFQMRVSVFTHGTRKCFWFFFVFEKQLWRESASEREVKVFQRHQARIYTHATSTRRREERESIISGMDAWGM
jgi:hypothetical protein